MGDKVEGQKQHKDECKTEDNNQNESKSQVKKTSEIQLDSTQQTHMIVKTECKDDKITDEGDKISAVTKPTDDKIQAQSIKKSDCECIHDVKITELCSQCSVDQDHQTLKRPSGKSSNKNKNDNSKKNIENKQFEIDIKDKLPKSETDKEETLRITEHDTIKNNCEEARFSEVKAGYEDVIFKESKEDIMRNSENTKEDDVTNESEKSIQQEEITNSTQRRETSTPKYEEKNI